MAKYSVRAGWGQHGPAKGLESGETSKCGQDKVSPLLSTAFHHQLLSALNGVQGSPQTH